MASASCIIAYAIARQICAGLWVSLCAAVRNGVNAVTLLLDSGAIVVLRGGMVTR